MRLTEQSPFTGSHPAHPGARPPRPADATAARVNAQLLPTLFDRLRDEAPSRTSESPSDYTVTPAQMRDIVQRDLAHLLNTTNAEDLIGRTRHADAASSSINFGVPPLAGSYLSERKWVDIERIIRRAIQDYEPRLIPETVTVVPLMKEGGAAEEYNVLLFEIRAMINLRPYPLELTVQSAVDLETSRMSVISTAR
ncbi:type VI secretion system baseplate subunit TssE [Variovorax sp. PAMC26660]|uniref:type VI secretion system baseplate subunit TssE n=1 Tax=Variovorax sp. PAMC26660 TaxID=2762322 RepID=UPI00164E0F72|nr:type VI secretion system baseplate subunit TssE [Variovorax sp. PAMC26660]QNK68129.1 type VI secretion system baseplate subunit TssE [Variovorax sp. PAMC26660]